MKNLHVLLMVSLLTCAGGVAIAQDLDAGLKAAQAGDFQTALKEWKPLADQGHAYAQYNLGLMYANGEGVAEDDAEAVRWYRLAADQGHADAQYNLGWMYAIGEGVVEDDAEAVRWYRLAADQGHADAQNNLGVMYDNGRVCRKMTPRRCAGTGWPPIRGTPMPRTTSAGCTPTARVYCRTMSLLTCGLISRARMAPKMGATTAKSSKGK